MKSAIYEGELYHERTTPKKHAFQYKVFMVLLYLDEIDQFFELSPFWSKTKFAPAQFKRSDYFGDTKKSISESICEKVEQEIGFYPNGSVAILTNLRYWGIRMNPLNTYYCMNKEGELVAIVAQVNNTPWNESHAYVLDCRGKNREFKSEFKKAFTVSPFNVVNMNYFWKSNYPGQNLNIAIDARIDNKNIVRASLTLQKQTPSTLVLNSILIKYPMMTIKVVTGIYWQALKLFLKGVPFLGKNKKQEMTFLEQ